VFQGVLHHPGHRAVVPGGSPQYPGDETRHEPRPAWPSRFRQAEPPSRVDVCPCAGRLGACCAPPRSRELPQFARLTGLVHKSRLGELADRSPYAGRAERWLFDDPHRRCP
jgi:hypothetical protein